MSTTDDSPQLLNQRVYDTLRRLAEHLRPQQAGASLQPTLLVHEAWLRLANWQGEWKSEAHFRATAAKAMRQYLIDQHRRRDAQKRGGDRVRTTLSGLGTDAPAFELLDLHDALEELKVLDPRGAQIVEYRYFGGMSVQETAQIMELSESAIYASWRLSRAWLENRLRSP